MTNNSRSGYWNTIVTSTLPVAHQQWSLKELLSCGIGQWSVTTRYKWMASDGDTKAFSSVENVYGEFKQDKLDCVGHVQKRMEKHLLNLKARTKGKLADG